MTTKLMTPAEQATQDLLARTLIETATLQDDYLRLVAQWDEAHAAGPQTTDPITLDAVRQACAEFDGEAPSEEEFTEALLFCETEGLLDSGLSGQALVQSIIDAMADAQTM